MADQLTYHRAGVSATGDVLGGLLGWVNKTLEFRRGRTGDSTMDIGFYANVLNLGGGVGLAFSTDGVGTKILIAEMLNKYDTIGIDCVAMNVNDLVCVGAEPLAMLDYIAVENADSAILAQIGKGLHDGAREANISIPGGELAQLGQMIRGLGPGAGLDLVGACVGLVLRGGRMLLGQDMADGDVIIGMESSGVHSNGLTLARMALLNDGDLTVHSTHPDLVETVGQTLLTPTRIYVRTALELIENVEGLRALAHITSDGFLNLLRIPGCFSYDISNLPPCPPIFGLIQARGHINDAEMYRVFNMGVGMCAIVRPDAVTETLRICSEQGTPARTIGTVRASSSPEVVIQPVRLRGENDAFVRF